MQGFLGQVLVDTTEMQQKTAQTSPVGIWDKYPYDGP